MVDVNLILQLFQLQAGLRAEMRGLAPPCPQPEETTEEEEEEEEPDSDEEWNFGLGSFLASPDAGTARPTPRSARTTPPSRLGTIYSEGSFPNISGATSSAAGTHPPEMTAAWVNVLQQVVQRSAYLV